MAHSGPTREPQRRQPFSICEKRHFMTTSASARPTRVMSKYTRWLGWILIAVCLAAAVYLPVFDKENSELLGSVMLVVGAALVAAGLSMASRNCPVAVMKTAHWWPWDLPSGGHQRRWFRCASSRSPWLGDGQVRSAW